MWVDSFIQTNQLCYCLASLFFPAVVTRVLLRTEWLASSQHACQLSDMPVHRRSHTSKQWQLPHFTHAFILAAHRCPRLLRWVKRTKRARRSVITLTTHAAVCRMTGSRPATSLPEEPYVAFGRGVGVINVRSSINGQPGPTHSLSPHFWVSNRQIFCHFTLYVK